MRFFRRKPSDLEKRVTDLEKRIGDLSITIVGLKDSQRQEIHDHEIWRREFNAATRRHNDVMEKWAEALLKAVSK